VGGKNGERMLAGRTGGLGKQIIYLPNGKTPTRTEKDRVKHAHRAGGNQEESGSGFKRKRPSERGKMAK